MDFIAPHLLWIGHAGDGRDARAICGCGIEAVLQLATEEPLLQLPREILLFRIPIVDGDGSLDICPIRASVLRDEYKSRALKIESIEDVAKGRVCINFQLTPNPECG